MSRRHIKTAAAAAIFLLQSLIVETQGTTEPHFLILRHTDTSTSANSSMITTNSTGNATKPSSTPKKLDPAVKEHWRMVRSVAWFWLAIAVVMMLVVFVNALHKYIRTVSCMDRDNQRYFAIPFRPWGLFKKHFLDAPLIRKRHHREFMLSRAIGMGCLPSRSQTFMIVGYIAMTVTLTCYNIPFHAKRATVLPLLTQRTGLLALINMLPLFLLAGRNNPLIVWTGVTFDTYNLYHRWIGRIVSLEAITHALCYLINKVGSAGWAAVHASILKKSHFILSGIIVSCVIN
jgi:ferric reductase like protein